MAGEEMDDFCLICGTKLPFKDNKISNYIDDGWTSSEIFRLCYECDTASFAPPVHKENGSSSKDDNAVKHEAKMKENRDYSVLLKEKKNTMIHKKRLLDRLKKVTIAPQKEEASQTLEDLIKKNILFKNLAYRLLAAHLSILLLRFFILILVASRV